MLLLPSTSLAQQPASSNSTNSDDNWYLGKGLTPGMYFVYNVTRAHYADNVSNSLPPTYVNNVTMTVYVMGLDNKTGMWTLLINVRNMTEPSDAVHNETMYISNKSMTGLITADSPHSIYYYGTINDPVNWFEKPGSSIYTNDACSYCWPYNHYIGQENITTASGTLDTAAIKVGKDMVYVDKNLPYPVKGGPVEVGVCHITIGGGGNGCHDSDIYTYQLYSFGGGNSAASTVPEFPSSPLTVLATFAGLAIAVSIWNRTKRWH